MVWIAVAGVIGIIFGVGLVALCVPQLGLLRIDMNSSLEKDIARFEFDMPLEEAVKHKIMIVKIEKAEKLTSMDGRL